MQYPAIAATQAVARHLRPVSPVRVRHLEMPEVVRHEAGPGYIHRRCRDDVSRASSVLLVCDRGQMERHDAFLAGLGFSVHRPETGDRLHGGMHRQADLVDYADLERLTCGRNTSYDLAILDESGQHLGRNQKLACLRLNRLGLDRLINFNRQVHEFEEEHDRQLSRLLT